MLSLTVNGKVMELEQEVLLSDFLAERQINSRHVAVARNGEVVDRDAFGETPVHAGDVIEIVRMVGGG